jgi:hypothetical protein
MGMSNFTTIATGTFGDWQRDYLYKFIVLEEPKGDPTKGAWADFQAQKGPLLKDDIDLHVEAAPVPDAKVNKIALKREGQTAQFSGKLDSNNTVQLMVVLDEAAINYQYFYAWRQLSGTDADNQALGKEKTIGKVAMLMFETDKETPSRGRALSNVIVTDLGEFPTKRDGDGLLKYPVTIAYDFAGDYPD